MGWGMRRTWVIFVVVVVGDLPPIFAQSAAALPPPQFTDTAIGTLAAPTAIAVTPDGRILLTQQSGRLRVITAGSLQTTPALDLSARMCSNSERGLLGVATDPDPATHAIFLFHTSRGTDTRCPAATTGLPEPAGAPRNRLSRFVLRADNTVDPASETVLLDGIYSPAGYHNAGDLHVGKDGYLCVTTGEGGCDYRGDAGHAGGSGCGGESDASRDRNILNGKVLRINRLGGIPAGNPFVSTTGAVSCHSAAGPAGSTCLETFAMGLRNPSRFAIDPNAAGTVFRINDVGQNVLEEIDHGARSADYGEPVREGHCQQTGSPTDCGAPKPAAVTDPIDDYVHSDTCASITCGAHVPNGVWPSSYSGAYLFSDYACRKIVALSPAGVRTEFLSGLGDNSAVDLTFGPFAGGQALYYTTYGGGGQVRRIADTGSSNRAPTAALTASPSSGPAPLVVTLNGSASSDPDRNAPVHLWSFGDGSAGLSTMNATTAHSYRAGDWTATLRTRDPGGLVSAPTTLAIRSGNTAPAVTITAPQTGQLFTVGTGYTLRGSATDQEDGPLPAGTLSWTVVRHHDAHTHPFLGPVSGNNIPITGPGPENLAAASTSYLQIQLTAKDSHGVATTATRDFKPRTVPVTFATSPVGRTVTVNGTPMSGPATVTSWVGYGLQVAVPAQSEKNGQVFGFDSWSDGGAASHVYSTPSVAATLTARLSVRGTLASTPTAVAVGQTAAGTPP